MWPHVSWNSGYLSGNNTQFSNNQRWAGNFCFVYPIWFYYNKQVHIDYSEGLACIFKVSLIKWDFKEKIFSHELFWSRCPHLTQRHFYLNLFFFVVLLFSHSVVSNSFATLWTAAHQTPLSMIFPRQECWSGLPFPTQGDLPDLGIEPEFAALVGGFFFFFKN